MQDVIFAIYSSFLCIREDNPWSRSIRRYLLFNICIWMKFQWLGLFPNGSTTHGGVMNLPTWPVVLESTAQTGEEAAAALCSRATRSTGGSDVGQSPRLLLLKVVCLVWCLCPYGRLSRFLSRHWLCTGRFLSAPTVVSCGSTPLAIWKML